MTDLQWLRNFIRCTPFGADAGTADIDRAHDIVTAFKERVTQLEAEVAEARAKSSMFEVEGNKQFARAEKAEAEVAALRADAERYRWLRDNRLTYRTHPIADGWTMNELIYDTAEQGPDAAIDAARKP